MFSGLAGSAVTAECNELVRLLWWTRHMPCSASLWIKHLICESITLEGEFREDQEGFLKQHRNLIPFCPTGHSKMRHHTRTNYFTVVYQELGNDMYRAHSWKSCSRLRCTRAVLINAWHTPQRKDKTAQAVLELSKVNKKTNTCILKGMRSRILSSLAPTAPCRNGSLPWYAYMRSEDTVTLCGVTLKKKIIFPHAIKHFAVNLKEIL